MPHDTQPARSSRDEVAAGMLQAPTLAALAGIRHAFFTRDGGVSDGIYASLNGGPGSEDAPANVTENRARMASTLGVRPDCFLTAYQIHSPDVVTVERPWSAHERPRADAIVTRTPGLAIGVTTADCGPVLLADQQAGVIGAAHAGWRGAATGVLEATIAAMERCGADRAHGLTIQPLPPNTIEAFAEPLPRTLTKSSLSTIALSPMRKLVLSGSTVSRPRAIFWKNVPSSPAGLKPQRARFIAMNFAVVLSPRDGVSRPSISSDATK